MGKMFLMCGLSGAGKTTFARKFVRENYMDYFSIDDFYNSYAFENNITSPWEDTDASFKVWIRFFEAIHSAELSGRDILIDTNAPTFVKRAQFIDWFPSFDEHNLIYIEANRDLRRRNNASRDRIVPDDEMERMEREFESPVIYGDYSLLSNDECNWSSIIVIKNIDNHFHGVDIIF